MPFIRQVVSRKRTAAGVADVPRVLISGLRRDRDGLKAIVTHRAFVGVHRSILEKKAHEFAHCVHDKWLRTDTLETLRNHKEQGHRIGIVSASYAMYLRPIGQRLELDFVLATELEFDENDTATGRILGKNCRGPEKAKRLQSWFDSQGLVSPVLFAYGDSVGDREMLEMADHPRLVKRPSRK